MQKKLIALAVAAALTAPALALADSGNVTLYGVMDADVVSVKTDKGATQAAAAGGVPANALLATSRGRVDSNASRFGVKGEEALGDGLAAIFQFETRVVLNNNDGTNFALRNSNVGLKGAFGTAFVGNWDTPFKTSHNKVELFDNSSIATNTALLGNINGTNTFNLRQNSSVQYWTPIFSGFQVKGAYSFVSPTAATTAAAPSLLSISAAYDQDGIYVALANEQHKDYSITNTAATTTTAASTTAAFAAGQKDSATRLVGAYTVDAFQVGLTYERAQTQAAAAASATRNAFALSGKYSFDANSIGASYTKAGDNGAAVNTGATQVSLRYGYAFSKRTEAYGLYTQIANKANGTYNFTDVAGVSSVAGAKVSGFGVGVRHTF